MDWAKNPVSKPRQFGKDKRLTIAGEIMKDKDNKEKNSPGPCGYDNHK
jgi:hypothetical protein